jgi:formate dehydrogenase major subunit
VLPGTTFLEKDGTFVNSDRRIQRVRQAIEPRPGTRIDGDIINQIARRMGVDLHVDNGPGTPIDPCKVMTELASLTPKWRGVSYQRLDEKGFLQWPCYDESHPGTEIVHEGGVTLRPNHKAKLTVTPWQEPGELPCKDYPFMLTTGRMLFHYNVGTMTRRTDVSLLAKAKEESLRIHPSDARKIGIKTGELVNITSRRGSVKVKAEVTRATNPGTLFMTFHFPESRTNILIGSAVDEFTGCPEYKISAVRVEKVSAEAEPATGGASAELAEARLHPKH